METQAKMHVGTRLIAGTIMVIAGGLLAFGHAGILNAVEIQRSWPVILIALAFLQLVTTLRNARQRGWALLLLGDWLFLNTMTDWTYQQFSWPLLVAGVGSWMIAGGVKRANRSLKMDHHVA